MDFGRIVACGSLLLTLLLTPVAYELLDRRSPKALRERQWNWKLLFKGASEKPSE